ncbi:MAG: flagellum-specific ATP synthase FliI, partial [Actinobacteria bacterium]|nr:flagellum-specific ATP synthase FliI [Actinomycetota bacterium]
MWPLRSDALVWGGGVNGALASAGGAIDSADLVVRRGRVRDVIGLIIEASGLEAEVGEVCRIETGRHRPPVPAEVVGFRDSRTLLMPLGEMTGIGPGKPVTAEGEAFRVPVGEALLGQVVDSFGRPLDGSALHAGGSRSAAADPPEPLGRPRIEKRLALGVRALDAFVPCGQGQRLGIFAGSGVGKSSLLGMIARSTSADVNVIALVGERGREVREFVERDLGPALER